MAAIAAPAAAPPMVAMVPCTDEAVPAEGLAARIIEEKERLIQQLAEAEKDTLLTPWRCRCANCAIGLPVLASQTCTSGSSARSPVAAIFPAESTSRLMMASLWPV